MQWFPYGKDYCFDWLPPDHALSVIFSQRNSCPVDIYMPVLVKPLLRFLLVRLSISLFKRLGNLENKNFRRKVRWKIISSQNFEFYIVHKVVTAHHWQSCRTWESGMLYDYSSPVQGTCFPSSSGTFTFWLALKYFSL